MRRLTLARAMLLATAACLVPSPPAAAGTPAFSTLKKRLLRVPIDGTSGTVVRLPVGDGSQGVFRVRDSQTLPPALAAKFPGLRSYRGVDAHGRTLRLDMSSGGLRMSVRDGAREWTFRARTAAEWSSLSGPEPLARPPAPRRVAAPAANRVPPRPSLTTRSGAIRYDFRLAVATSSRYAARFGGTVEGTLAEVAHAVNRANEVFETDAGVHFTLVDANDRLIRTRPSHDPFLREDPSPAAANLIDREIGPAHYDIGHALTDYTGGESHVGTSCSNARDADFLATHKAAAWSGHGNPEADTDAIGFMIHVLGRQLGAWPTASGCPRDTLEDRTFEPGSGTTAMGYAPSPCGRTPALQAHSDRYFHAANIEQIQDWLASRGGRCASRRINPSAAPWIAPQTFASRITIPARTPFYLDARAEPGVPGRVLSYTWEQMDAGPGQRGILPEGDGPLFRSLPPSATGRRVFPRMTTLPGREDAASGETLPRASRSLNFRLTVRDNGGDTAHVTHADTRLDIVDTGRPFALHEGSPTFARAGGFMTVGWDVADTDRPPVSCHFVTIDLSLDDGETWREPALAIDEPNDGEARLLLPRNIASEQARLRIRCDWRPFFALSPRTFRIDPATNN